MSSDPIEMYLNGPLDTTVAPGDQVTGPVSGMLTVVWDGTEWQYSAYCITAPTAGTYVWTLNNTNSPTGIDDIASSGSIVTVTDPVIIVTDPETTDPGAAESGDGGSFESASTSSSDTAPTLATTGAPEGSWQRLGLAAAFLSLIGMTWVIAGLLLNPRARSVTADITQNHFPSTRKDTSDE